MANLVRKPEDNSDKSQIQQPEAWSFNQPVLLNKTKRVSSTLVWTAVAGTALVGVWAFVAPLPETISVQGKLQPGLGVRDIEAPANGIVEAVLVKDGQTVAAGQTLLRFDQRDALAKLSSAKEVRSRLINENAVYKYILGEPLGSGLTPNQKRQLISQQTEIQSRNRAASEDLAKSKARLAGLETNLSTARNIANRYRRLVNEGASSQVQLLEAQSRVDELQAQANAERREVARLSATASATLNGSESELRQKIEANLKQIAELDKQISEAQLLFSYNELKAPSAGTVFDVSVKPGAVVNEQDGSPLLRIVPQGNLQAKVYIPNASVGFIQKGQRADLSLDTFNASDYGRIPGTVERVGSDALTPEEQSRVLGNQTTGLYFPATIKLSQQYLKAASKKIPLQAGMSLSADIHLRDRRFISILVGFFEDKRRSLERLR